MVTYDEVKETFEKEGCKLVTTREEMNNCTSKSVRKYHIIASCGHEIENCWYHMFKYRGTGKICKACIDSKQVLHGKAIMKSVVDCNSYTLSIEHQSIELIKKYIGALNIELSPECCLADIAIKTPTCTDDKWLPVQVKATIKGRFDVYSFGLKQNYPDMLVLFVCIEAEKFWILNGNEILNQCKVSIGMKKSKKYDKYAVDKNMLHTKLEEFYNTDPNLKTLSTIQEPITDTCKTEQMFCKLRQSKLYSIPFECPKINQSVYDFKVNGFKIQEKTAYLTKGKISPSVVFAKNNGRKNKSSPYHIKDNDFYWVNLPDKTHFYIFPASVLSENNILSTDSTQGCKNLIISKSKPWINSYKHSYDEPNVNMIISNLFGLTIGDAP